MNFKQEEFERSLMNVDTDFDDICNVLFFCYEDVLIFMKQKIELNMITLCACKDCFTSKYENLFKFDIKDLNRAIESVVQECLDTGKHITVVTKFCLDYAKLLDLNNIQDGTFYHSVGLLMQKVGKTQEAEKYFVLALLCDIGAFENITEVKKSNAYCVLITTYNTNFYKGIFDTYVSKKKEYPELTNMELYEFMEVL